MIHKMKLWVEPFKSIKNGAKDIELRLNNPKRQMINIGDTILFINNQTKEEITCLVTNLYYRKSFEKLFNEFDKVRLAYKIDEEASYLDMEKYYLKEEILKYGVLGIEIKKM